MPSKLIRLLSGEELVEYNDFQSKVGNTRTADMEECYWWFWDVPDGNCRITHCYDDKWQNPDDRAISNFNIYSIYKALKDRCDPLRAGGWNEIRFPPEDMELPAGGGAEILTVYNDDTPRAKRDWSADRAITKRGNVMEGTFSRAEYEEMMNSTAVVEQTTSRKDKRASRSTKRQSVPDDDNEAMINFVATNIRNPNAYETGLRLSPGVGYEYSTQEGTTFTTTTSVSVGAAWNVFTASAGIDKAEGESYTVAEGLTFDVDCPNQAQITFWPYYDYYEVIFQPSGTWAEIWVPAATGKTITGEIAVDSIG